MQHERYRHWKKERMVRATLAGLGTDHVGRALNSIVSVDAQHSRTYTENAVTQLVWWLGQLDVTIAEKIFRGVIGEPRVCCH